MKNERNKIDFDNNELFSIIKILDFYESNVPNFEDVEIQIFYNIRQKIIKPIDEKIKKQKERTKRVGRFFKRVSKNELNKWKI